MFPAARPESHQRLIVHVLSSILPAPLSDLFVRPARKLIASSHRAARPPPRRRAQSCEECAAAGEVELSPSALAGRFDRCGVGPVVSKRERMGGGVKESVAKRPTKKERKRGASSSAHTRPELGGSSLSTSCATGCLVLHCVCLLCWWFSGAAAAFNRWRVYMI